MNRAWAFLTCGALLATVADWFSKRYAQTVGMRFAVAAVIIYGLGSLFWLALIREKCDLTRYGTIWSLATMAGNCAIGLLVFKETLNVQQGIGLVLAFVALVLLS